MNISTFIRSAAFAASAVFALNANAANVDLFLSADPEPGEVTELSTVTLSFGAAVFDTEGNTTLTCLSVKDQNGKEYAHTAVSNNRRATVTVTLNEAVTTPGTYTVSAPEGVLMTMSGETNTAFSVQYTIPTPATKYVEIGEFDTNPDASEDQTSLSSVMYVFYEPNELSIVAWETNDASLAYAYVEKDGVQVTKGLLDFTTVRRQELLTVEFDDVISTPGKYTVVIPAGALKDATTGDVYDKVEVTYNVVGMADAVFEASPASGSELSSLVGNITFTYTGYNKVGNANGPMTIPVLDADGKTVASLESSLPGFKNVLQLTIDEDDAITTPGTYTITIPAGGLVGYLDEDGNSEPIGAATVTYTVAAPATKYVEIGEFDTNPDASEDQTSLSSVMYVFYEPNELSIVAWETNDASLAYAYVEKDGVQVTKGLLDFTTVRRQELLTVEFDDVISTPGKYTVVIPAGALKDATTGDVYDKVEVTYNVVGMADAVFEASPASGSELSSLVGNITFTYTGYNKVGNANGPMTIPVLDADGKTVASLESSLPGFKNVLQLTIDEDDAITTPGTYTITIPAGGLVGYLDEDGNSEPIGAATVTYTVTGNSTDPDTPAYTVSVDPAEGEVEQISKVVVTFAGATAVKASDEAGPKDYPYYGTVDADGNITKVSQMRAAAYGSTNTIEINAYTAVTAPGSYAVVVPAAYYTVDGVAPTEALVFRYTIPQPEVKMTMEVEFINVEEEEEYDDLDKIEFTFVVYDANYSRIDSGLTFKRDSTKAPKMGLLSSDGSKVESYNNGTISGSDPHLIWASYYGVETNGMYLFSIPANYMSATDAAGNVVKNDDIYAMFILERQQSGVDSVRVEIIGSNDVYNLQGVKVGTSTDNLPAGIYIVGGKKVLVK